MTSLRERAAEVRAAGVAERGNFTPPEGPKRVYDYWLNNTNSRKGRDIYYGNRHENFCHFWRVVAIWAPLLWVRNAMTSAAPVLVPVLALLAALGFIFLLVASHDFLMVTGTILGTFAVILLGSTGIVSGVSAGVPADSRVRNALFTDRRAIVAFFVLGLPVALPAYLVTRLVRLYKDHLTPYNRQISLTLLVAIPVTIFTLVGVFGGVIALLQVLGVLVASVAAAAAAILLGVVATDLIVGRREVAAQRHAAEREEYYEEHGEYPPKSVKRRGPLSFVADFFVFFVQVLRVSKWKICPLVEIDNKN